MLSHYCCFQDKGTEMSGAVDLNHGAHGSVDLSSCDQEPIHTPSSIQPNGALVVVTRADLMVTHASLNLG